MSARSDQHQHPLTKLARCQPEQWQALLVGGTTVRRPHRDEVENFAIEWVEPSASAKTCRHASPHRGHHHLVRVITTDITGLVDDEVMSRTGTVRIRHPRRRRLIGYQTGDFGQRQGPCPNLCIDATRRPECTDRHAARHDGTEVDVGRIVVAGLGIVGGIERA